MPNININSIAPDSKVYISGIVDYSRIASQLEGDELAADNAKKAAKGMIAIDKPHTRITIKNASVDYIDKANPTLAEQFIAERLYTSSKHPENGLCFTAHNKSRNLPALYCRPNKLTMQLEEVTAKGELASGVPVTIMVRFFAATRNLGMSLDLVIVDEKPVKFYTGNTNASVLAERGFQIIGTASEADTIRTQLETPVTANVPAQPPVAPAPYMSTPVATAPTQPATPSAVAPQNPSLPTPPEGYMYDENNRIVPIPATGGIRLD